MHPVVCHIIAFYETIYRTLISTNNLITNVPAFVYLANMSIQVSTLTRSSSGESTEM
jgi:hypothetical protein